MGATLRSAAVPGVDHADASSNASAAVLAHSNRFIKDLAWARSALALKYVRPGFGSITGRGWAADFRATVAARPQRFTRGGFSANPSSTYGPRPSRCHWPGRPRWHAFRRSSPHSDRRLPWPR